MAKMKLFCVVVAAMFLIPPVSMMQNGETADGGTETIVESMAFSQPTIEDKGKYVSVSIEGANEWLMENGKPELPIYVKTIKLPDDASNVKVVCTPKEIGTMDITKEIVPVKEVIGSYENVDTTLVKDEQVYSSDELYPDSWYSYHIGCGLDGEDRVTFVKIVCNVVRYSPAENKLEYVKGMGITVKYEEPDKNVGGNENYDLVVIAPRKFEWELQSLVNHKNSHGMNTVFKRVEDIISEYEGVDAPEKIKYFIKDAIETWDITYVLLVGGLKSYISANDKDDCNQGTTAWHVPVRYTNIQHSGEVGVISDLYYGDVYKYDNGDKVFADWDPNGNDIFADIGDVPNLDLYPDVYVGRLACRNKREVKLMVKKITKYEKTSPDDKPWFKTMVGIGGKTFQIYHGQPDGEYVCDTSIDYMGDLVDEAVRVYASNRDTGGPVPITKDIARAISRGAGYVDFQGHGNPISWNTIWHDGEYPDDWTGGIQIYNFERFLNFKKLPVVVVGGCHNALFNVTIMKTLRSGNYILEKLLPLLEKLPLGILLKIVERFLLPKTWYWTYGLPAPVCFSWGLCVVPWGGAIASTGCTGYGIGYQGMPISLSAEMESNLFYEIGQDGATNLGNAHGGAITKFINENAIGDTEAFCITEYQLFGDPSLKLGGYS